MNINWLPLCVLRFVESIEKFKDDDGTEYEVAGLMKVKYGFPSVEAIESHRKDVGLLKHEFEHVNQFWWMVAAVFVVCALLAALEPAAWWLWLTTFLIVGPAMHPLCCRVSRGYRQWCEVEAYAVQMQYPDKHGGFLSLDMAAWLLARPKYRLGITVEEARLLLLAKTTQLARHKG